MSISSQLTLLANTKESIRTSINNKGGSVGASDTFASYATAIDNLPSGGSGNPLLRSIDVSDFSGTSFNAATSYITSVTIPNTVTLLGTNAFNGFSGLTSITIPSSVTMIGNYTFQGCTGLTSITIPSGVTSIGNYAFNGCTGLTSITIPSGVTDIAAASFQGCTGLTSITIPSGVTSIGNYAFNGCTGLTSITIPSVVTYVGANSFTGCNRLTSITFPSTVATIGYNSFNNCSELTSIICLAATPPTLGNSAFNGTNNCPIYVPAESVAAYKAAGGWSTYESRIYAIAQVATVDNTPVYNYDLGMTSSTTMITSTNMQKMPTGTSLELAEGIVDAGGSFGNYTSITLPSTFSSFDDQGMIGNTTTTLTCLATTPPTAERNDIGGANLTAIYVPAANVADYQANATWSSFSSIIQAIPTE